MKKLLNTLCILFFIGSIYAQSTFKIEGIVEDTLANPLIYSTILLLEESDSTMVDFSRTELDGSFKFKDVSPGAYLVKTTYLGYIPLHIPVSSMDGADVDLGVVKMTEMATELMEVVIKAAKAQIKMRGDTIEYDATTFKVPEGSSVEELLRKLPGMEVDVDGSILSDGKSVSKVTVDGKSFFGDNPKAATQNLPAESISKVQVFDRKSEEEEITGATSEAQDKTMNLELKEDYKSGAFGRVVAGVGTESLRELKGNFNRFNDKIQFSIVGVGNNTGRNGLSWDDYQDFMGSNSFNFNNDTDYGFGGGGRYYSFGGGGNGLESSIQSIFFQGRGDNGLPENYNGGFNFNYDHEKTKLGAVYYYNQSGLYSESNTESDRFFETFEQNNLSRETKDNVSRGHRMELQLEQEIDSLHTLKIILNGAYINQDEVTVNTSVISSDNVTASEGNYLNDTNTSGYLVNGIAIFRKKFKKKGRSMGLNGSFLSTELDDNWIQDSRTIFLNQFNPDGSMVDPLLILQNNANVGDKNLFKANALYVEPISKKFFYQVFYNFSDRTETGDRDVFDLSDGQSLVNSRLSRDFDNTFRHNRVGNSLRYSHDGMNITAGLAYQTIKLGGDFRSLDESLLGEVSQNYNNLIPHLSINFSPVRNAYVSVGYSRKVTEPSVTDLQPIINDINPLFIRIGNPDLVPEVADEINVYVSRSYPASSVRFSLNGSMSFFDNRITRKENVDDKQVTTYQPINLEGGRDANFWTSVSFPIIKGKIKSRVSMNGYFSNMPAIFNDVETTTNTAQLTPRISLDFTPVDDVAVYVNGSIGRSRTTFDIQTSQDQTVTDRRLGVEFNTKLFAGFFLNSNYNYTNYSNDRFDTDTTIPILNASIYRQFMPGKKAELRLAIYDALNKNRGFYQGAFGNSVSQTSSLTLSRYVMLSLTYNIKGLKSGVRKDGWH